MVLEFVVDFHHYASGEQLLVVYGSLALLAFTLSIVAIDP